MVVRQMTNEDVERVYQLSQECFSEPWSLESIQKEVSNPVASYFVAESDHQIIGYGGLWHVLDEGDIINIAVNSQYRRQGIGQAILKKLLEEAEQKALCVLHLEVREGNEAAIHLYKKHGFEVIAVRKGYYHHPLEDALIMECQLKAI